MRRYLSEKFNIYIYIIIPALLIVIYRLLNIRCNFYLSTISNYNNYKFEFTYSMLALLLTLLGLMLALPNNKYRELMKEYKHDEIIYNTLFTGIISSIAFIILYLIEKFPEIQDILFIVMVAEIVISSIWLFVTIKNINKSSKKNNKSS